MRIVHGRPPNFAEIVAAFPRAVRPGVIFAYGDAIFNPAGTEIAPELLAHELVHIERQKDPADWWRQYIAKPEFRLLEEAMAHKMEFVWLTRNGNRHARRGALVAVAKKLASPLYGSLCTVEQAKRMLWC